MIGYDIEDEQAMDNAFAEFFVKGKVKSVCPRCGKTLCVEESENGENVNVYCPNNCISSVFVQCL